MRALPSWLLLPVLAACASTPVPIAKDAEPVLKEAEGLLAAGNAVAARNLLQSRSEATFPAGSRDRYELTLATALMQLNATWDAFLAIREFADHNPHSELRTAVIKLEWEIGRTLSRSDHGFLFFWSDRRGGRTCLEHLITRYPDNPYLADALKTLGDMAFDDGSYELAIERYRDLIRRRQESEWGPYARFRYAMSIVASLQGPEYDLDQMQHATKELRAFLANPPENIEFNSAADAALQRLLRWQSERQLLVADFYRTIHNRTGYLHHLRLAAADEFAGTPANALSRARLQTDERQSQGAGQ